MKAMVLHAKATPFVMRERPIPVVNEEDVLVKLKASAINHRDYFIQQGIYPRITYPVIIGSDGSGVVVDIGVNVPTSLLDTNVVINPSHQWGDNPHVQGSDFKVLGFPDNGTFAEYISVPAKYVQPKPHHLSFEEAAALLLSGLTAYRALFTRGNLQTNENVLVTGIGGGVAVTAMQFAVAVGAKVFVTSGAEEKIKKAVALGASGGANYKSATWAEELKKLAGGFDLIVDGAVGTGFSGLLDVASPGARIVIYGSTQGKIKNAEPARIFWKQLSILGSTMGTEEEFAAMLQFVEQHNIKPVIDEIFSLGDAEKAIRRMDNAKQFGKIVLRNF